MDDNDRFDRIMAAISVSQAAGKRIVAGCWGVGGFGTRGVYIETRECLCPLGALLVGHSASAGRYEDAAFLLDVTVDWVAGFIEGFDGKFEKLPPHPDLRANRRSGRTMGRRVQAALKNDRSDSRQSPVQSV
jgi:hypothetical protein